ncbi:MAG: urate hydroxylase PuuD, partial [Caulobacter sp.]|nr:urate hydroxylase PuuD [Caulobacter sp.]
CIGTGMWLATVMFFNVWVFIWPNQKIALGMVEADADAKAKAAKTDMLFSRTNTLLSIPMLATMAMNQTLFG